MKILLASDCYKPVINGVVTSVCNLKEGLEAKGHEVRVLTLSNSQKSYIDGDAYYIGSLDVGKIYPGVIRFQRCSARKEMSDIIRWSPDIIHTQSEFCTFFIAKRIARKLQIPMVHTYHTIYEDYTHYFSASRRVGKQMVVKATRYVSRSVSCIIAPTPKIDRMLNGYRVKSKIKTIPTGIEMDKFEIPASVSDITALKESLQIPADHTVLLSVSRIGKEKNINELINCVKQLKGKKLSFVIVGDGPARASLQKMVDQADLGAQVKFTGLIKPEKVSLYYQMADLFVSASTSETQGLTYIEALAAGTPLLCRKDDCLDGVLYQGENGYSFVNETEFLQYLSDFMAREDKETMSVRAKEIAQKFSKENFVKNVEALYLQYVK